MSKSLITALAAMFLAAVPILAEPPATVDPTRPELAKGPYDTQADIGKQIADALRKAKRDNTRVLLQYGGNWCPKCLELHKLMKNDEAIAKVLLYEYQYVLADYGQPPGKNMNLPKQYGAEPNSEGVPYFTVLDSAGRMFANQALTVFEKPADAGKDSGRYDAAAVLKFLNANKASPAAAQTILDKGQREAKATGKRVFLHFGAPWCVWCHKLEDWMARPDVAPVLAKDFVEVKIDTDRNAGGENLRKKLAGDKNTGIPWFVLLDADGKPVAASFDDKGENIGFPAEAGEIDRFGAMLRSAAKNITVTEIDGLLATLRDKSGNATDAPPTRTK